jgi:hypothetical protein
MEYVNETIKQLEIKRDKFDGLSNEAEDFSKCCFFAEEGLKCGQAIDVLKELFNIN